MTRPTYRQEGSDTTREPITCPPYGVCVPVSIERVIDGDTVEVAVIDTITGRTGLTLFSVRLLDCWAPESRGPEREAGLMSKRYLQGLFDSNPQQKSLWIPFTDAQHTLATIMSMGRVLGRIFIGPIDVSGLMVSAGYAAATKHA